MDSLLLLFSAVAKSPLFGVASFILAIMGIILSIYFYRKGSRYKEISYAIQSDSLIENITERFPKLKISFGSDEIDALTVSRVAMWNSGTESIRGDDISTNDPLRVTLPEGSKVLSTEITSRTKDANSFSIVNDPQSNVLSVSLDYADPADGVVINIIHSGTRGSLGLKGSVVGLRRMRRRMAFFSLTRKSSNRFLNSRWSPILFSTGIGVVLLLFAVWSHTLTVKILMVVIGAFYVLIGLLFLLMARDTLPKKLQILDKGNNGDERESPNKRLEQTA